MEREEPTMRTKALTHAKPIAAPTAARSLPRETATKSPQTFYEKMVKRPDVREILTRLATMDREETR